MQLIFDDSDALVNLIEEMAFGRLRHIWHVEEGQPDVKGQTVGEVTHARVLKELLKVEGHHNGTP
jgi:hypothetical protein